MHIAHGNNLNAGSSLNLECGVRFHPQPSPQRGSDRLWRHVAVRTMTRQSIQRTSPSASETLHAAYILAFNGDLESRLALYWLVHERGYEVVTLLSISARKLFRAARRTRARSRRDGARRYSIAARCSCAISPCRCCKRTPSINRIASSALLARYVIAQAGASLAKKAGDTVPAHAAASKGNDQVHGDRHRSTKPEAQGARRRA